MSEFLSHCVLAVRTKKIFCVFNRAFGLHLGLVVLCVVSWLLVDIGCCHAANLNVEMCLIKLLRVIQQVATPCSRKH